MSHTALDGTDETSMRTPLPFMGISMTVKYRNHVHRIVVNEVTNNVRKATQTSLPNASQNDRPSQRITGNSTERRV